MPVTNPPFSCKTKRRTWRATHSLDPSPVAVAGPESSLPAGVALRRERRRVRAREARRLFLGGAAVFVVHLSSPGWRLPGTTERQLACRPLVVPRPVSKPVLLPARRLLLLVVFCCGFLWGEGRGGSPPVPDPEKRACPYANCPSDEPASAEALYHPAAAHMHTRLRHLAQRAAAAGSGWWLVAGRRRDLHSAAPLLYL